MRREFNPSVAWIIAGILLAIAQYFIWRSFYRMRIDETEPAHGSSH
jgi:predicted negative regulator of RcsB-dependent stress response